MKILITSFRGTAPRIDDEQLSEGLAVRAVNVDVSESLQGWYAPKDMGISFLASRPYIFPYNDTKWFSFQNRTSVVHAPLNNDPWNYAVFTDSAYPKITRNDVALAGAHYPAVYYRLGLPEPDAPFCSVENNTEYGGPSPDSEDYDGALTDKFDTSYVITFVDRWGRESITSVPSETITIREYEGEMVEQVRVTLPPAPTGYPLIQTNGTYRIYRLNNSSDGSGVYQYVDEAPITDNEYVDRTVSSQLLEATSTDTWAGPPDDDSALYPNGPLQNVSVVSEAFLCGNTTRAVCFSEPRIPHAWPVGYYQVFSEQVVRAIPLGSDVAVLTDEAPYILTGVHPSSMGRMKMPKAAPCVAADAVAVVSGSVFYAGAQGIYAMNTSGVNLVSETIYTLKQWRALDPKTMRFAAYDDTLIILTGDGQLLTFDISNPQAGIIKLDLGENVSHIYSDLSEGRFYFMDSGGSLFEFEGKDTRLPVTYETKHYRFHNPVNFYVSRVRANKFPVSVTIKAKRVDGTEFSYTKLVQNDRFFYIPAQSLMTEWWFEVSGNTEIRSLALATSIEELNEDV